MTLCALCTLKCKRPVVGLMHCDDYFALSLLINVHFVFGDDPSALIYLPSSSIDICFLGSKWYSKTDKENMFHVLGLFYFLLCSGLI